MADNEEITQEGSESSTPQAGDSAAGAGTGTENLESPEAGKGDAAGAGTNVDSGDIQKQLAELTKSNKERSQELLSTLDPYIDYDRMNANRGGAGGESSEEDEEFMSSKQVKALISNVSKTFKQELMAQNVRQKYPDVCDDGDNEVLVRHFIETKTLPTDSVEKRIDDAVKLTREHLKSFEDKGRKAAQTEKEAAEKTTAEKAAAAAKASGLATSGATQAPNKATEEDENKPVTPDDYVAGRQKKRLQRQNL